MINWEGFGRKLFYHSRGIIPGFVSRDWEKKNTKIPTEGVWRLSWDSKKALPIKVLECWFRAGMSNLRRKRPHRLLWAVSRAVNAKITVSGTHKRLNYWVIFIAYTEFNVRPWTRNRTWSEALKPRVECPWPVLSLETWSLNIHCLKAKRKFVFVHALEA